MKNYILMIIMLLAFKANAQEPIRPLKIGDTVPESFWEQENSIYQNGKTTKQNLSTYKGKLLILDFWATWCRSCLVSLEKVDAYHSLYGKDAIILPVTNQTEQVISPFLKNKGWKFGSVVGNKLLDQIFPHNTIPHVVWIKDGRILSATGADELNANNIAQVIGAKPFSFYEKKDKLDFNYSMPLLVDGNGGGKEYMLYHSVFTPYIDGLATQANKKKIGGELTKLCFTNFTVLGLFQQAYSAHNPLLNFPSRVVFDIPDSLKYRLTPPKDVLLELWTRNNTYCYELMVPKQMAKDFYHILRADIDRFFSVMLNLSFQIRQMKMTCLVLEQVNVAGNPSPTATAQSSSIANEFNFFELSPSVQRLLMKLATINKKSLPVVFSGRLEDIEIEMPTAEELLDMGKLNQKLEKHGLQLSKKEALIDMLVINSGKKLTLN